MTTAQAQPDVSNTHRRPTIDVLLAQYAPRKGAYAYNIGRIGEIFSQIEREGMAVDVLTFPETGLTGYFLEGGVRDVARPAEVVYADLQAMYLRCRGQNAPLLDIVVGFYEELNGAVYNAQLYATLGTVREGQNMATATPGLRHVHRKVFLPTYGVFDEERFVARGRRFTAFDTRFGRMGMLICEDTWHTLSATILALQGAQALFIGNASPARGFSGLEPGNVSHWRDLVRGVSSEHNLYVVLTNLVGFEGGKGFIGASVVTNPFGEVALEGPLGEECLIRTRLDLQDLVVARTENPLLADLESNLPDLVIALNHIIQNRQ